MDLQIPFALMLMVGIEEPAPADQTAPPVQTPTPVEETAPPAQEPAPVEGWSSAPVGPQVAPAPAATPPPQDKRSRAEALRQDPQRYAEYRRYKGMITGGAVSMGVGAAFAVAGVGWFIGNLFGGVPQIGPAVMWGVSGSAIITGAVLLGIGIPNRRRILREVSVAPQVGPRFSGARLRLRF